MQKISGEQNRKLVLGNYAVARGAFEAGVRVVTAYPGTPSTEITEVLARYPQVSASWSVNEKVALECAIGASLAGARAICSMKHVGLNVAADPLFTVAYTGVNAGLVIAVADDPGQYSSQNEQDTRRIALAAKVAALEPSDSAEALEFTKAAFGLSERCDMPVILRLVTRLSHSQSVIIEGEREDVPLLPYAKNIQKNLMIPAFARGRHRDLEQRLKELASTPSQFDRAENRGGKRCIVCAGVVYNYVREALPNESVYKIGRIMPLDIGAISRFCAGFEEVLVIEELEPYIEEQLLIAGIKCHGKEMFGACGELNAGIIKEKLLGTMLPKGESVAARPPALCAGCPHRAVFTALGKSGLTVMGDIGCYSLGALPPFNGMDSLVCMGAGIGMAAGAERALGRESARKTVAVIGDSTFIHSGITGLIEAVYCQLNTTIIILDNSTTGMTGHQQHPATGADILGNAAPKLCLEAVCKTCGASSVRVINAYDGEAIAAAVAEECERDGVSVIIVRGGCVLKRK